VIETLRVDQWLYGVLSGDSTLSALVAGRIYSALAPQDAALPFVVFNQQAGVDVRGVGPYRIMTSLVYQIKAIGRGGSFQPIAAIADRLDQLLQGASGSVVDGRILMCVREQPLAYVEVEDGVHYRHLGGLWRILSQET
jgi:hypothetical protein